MRQPASSNALKGVDHFNAIQLLSTRRFNAVQHFSRP
jgi:hypothetical protein